MRSRPTVRVRILPGVVEPGKDFVASVELESKSETPVDRVKITFEYHERSFLVQSGALNGQELIWKPGKLGIGKVSKDVKFRVPAGGAPSFQGAGTSASYLVGVHVEIPWWANRHALFNIPVVTPTVAPPERPPPLVATTDGPRAGELYVELSADRDTIAPGETLTGSVSFANVSTKRVRGVEGGFIRRETAPTQARWHEMNWTAKLVRGAPPEQESIPFRISLPADAVPSFRARHFAVEWRFEVRAQLMMGADVVLGFPLQVIRRDPDAMVRSRKPYLVGRDRWAAVWESIAERSGMTFSREEQALTAARGPVSLELRREVAGAHVAVVGRVRYPHLGLGLHLHERSFTDLLASRKVALKNPLAEGRLVATAREPAQAGAMLTPELLQSLLLFEGVQMSDDELTFSVARAATTTQTLTPVVSAAMQTLGWVASAIELVPPPSSMTSALPAWSAFAHSVSGRLERGRMWIHDGELVGERFEVGCVWSEQGSSIDTLARVHIAPPFETGFSVEDPGLSAATREHLRVLSKLPHFSGEPNALSWTIPGGTSDPEALRPDLERAAELVRGRRGLRATGPFR